MHKLDTSLKKNVSIVIAILMAIGLLTPMALQARASSVDASVGLDFSNSGSVDILANAPVGSSHTYREVLPGVDAIMTVIELTNHQADLTDSDGLDEYDSASATTDRWIPSNIDRVSSSTPGLATTDYAVSGYRLDFVASSDNTRAVIVDNLRLNAYDIDNEQRVEVSHVANYQLTPGTIVNNVVNLGDNVVRFTSDDVSASTSPSGSQVHSFGESRVQINFLSTSTLTVKMGVLGDGSQDFDFSTSGVGWVDSTGAAITAPAAVSPPAPASSGSAPAPVKQHVQTLNQTPAPGESVAMFGAYFGGITEAFVGGVKVDILSVSEYRIDIRMPRGLSGELDVELKSPLGTLILPKHFTIGKVAAAGTRKATLIVGGFAHNSRKLTPRMQARIDRWLERNSDLGTLTCTGFTSLPRRTTDVALSTNRGITACNFSKRERPELETAVNQGIEAPRPVSNVRRVRLVLTT